ncbi:S8 family serine peptidase [candidate division KSB1 bacterium]|nr:S8 family serine peptidase [candidate division KSB1 bacterium]
MQARINVTLVMLMCFLSVTSLSLAGGTTSFGIWNGGLTEFVDGEALLGLENGATWTDIAPYLTEVDLDSVVAMRRINSFTLYFDDTMDVVMLCDSVANKPFAQYCEPNMVMYEQSVDSYWGLQWYLHNTGQSFGTSGADIMWVEAATISRGDVNTKVAILDRGIPYDDEDNIFRNPDLDDPDRITLGCICHDEGFRGWNETNDPIQSRGHGTACAAIAGAQSNNDTLVAGVCPECGLVVEKMAHNGVVSIAHFSDALADAIMDHGASIISWSYSSNGASETARSAILSYADENVLFVFPTGNSGNDTIQFPANMVDELPDQIIAVGGTDQNDQRWREDDAPTCFGANYGTRISLVAPAGAYGCDEEHGPSCMTLLTLRQWNGSNSSLLCDNEIVDGQIGYKSGTSFSTPMVAGIAGLLRSYRPSLSPADVKSILQLSCDDVNANEADRRGYDEELGYGRVNAFKALLRSPGEKTLISDLTVRKHIYDHDEDGDDLSPYFLVDQLTVPQDMTLTINPGTRIKFDAGASLDISGKLQAKGTEAEPIIFEFPSNTGGGGIYFVNADSVELVHCIFKRAPIVFVQGGDYTWINNCTFDSCFYGLEAYDVTTANSLIEYNLFTHCRYGILGLASAGTFEYNTLDSCDKVGIYWQGDRTNGERARFTNNEARMA